MSQANKSDAEQEISEAGCCTLKENGKLHLCSIIEIFQGLVGQTELSGLATELTIN